MCVGKCRRRLPTVQKKNNKKRSTTTKQKPPCVNSNVVSSTSCLLCHSNYSALHRRSRAGLRSSMPRSNAGFPTHTLTSQQPPRTAPSEALAPGAWWRTTGGKSVGLGPQLTRQLHVLLQRVRLGAPTPPPRLLGEGGTRSAAVRDVIQHHATPPSCGLWQVSSMRLARCCVCWCSGATSGRKCARAASAGEQATRGHWLLAACHSCGNMRQAGIAGLQRRGCDERGSKTRRAHPGTP